VVVTNPNPTAGNPQQPPQNGDGGGGNPAPQTPPDGDSGSPTSPPSSDNDNGNGNGNGNNGNNGGNGGNGGNGEDDHDPSPVVTKPNTTARGSSAGSAPIQSDYGKASAHTIYILPSQGSGGGNGTGGGSTDDVDNVSAVEGSRGVPIGAMVGIVLGIVALMLCVAIAFIMVRRRRRQRILANGTSAVDGECSVGFRERIVAHYFP